MRLWCSFADGVIAGWLRSACLLPVGVDVWDDVDHADNGVGTRGVGVVGIDEPAALVGGLLTLVGSVGGVMRGLGVRGFGRAARAVAANAQEEAFQDLSNMCQNYVNLSITYSTMELCVRILVQ